MLFYRSEFFYFCWCFGQGVKIFCCLLFLFLYNDLGVMGLYGYRWLLISFIDCGYGYRWLLISFINCGYLWRYLREVVMGQFLDVLVWMVKQGNDRVVKNMGSG